MCLKLDSGEFEAICKYSFPQTYRYVYTQRMVCRDRVGHRYKLVRALPCAVPQGSEDTIRHRALTIANLLREDANMVAFPS